MAKVSKEASDRKVAKYHSTVKGRLTNLMCNIRQRCKTSNIELNISRDYLLGIYDAQHGRCALTGVEFDLSVRNGGKSICNPYSMSIDKINGKLGYVEGNVRIICTISNMCKGRWTDDVVINFCQKVVEYHG
jgi:hypothetical protein